MASMMPRVPTRDSSKAELNQFNIWLHQQPWWSQFLQQQGQNPARVKLSDAQRQQLQQVAAQQGIDLSGLDGMNFDPAGNLNTPHGFASQPTWLKATEIAAPVAAATMFGVPLTPFNGLLGGAAPSAAAAAPEASWLADTGAAAGAGGELSASTVPMPFAAAAPHVASTVGANVAGTAAGAAPSAAPAASPSFWDTLKKWGPPIGSQAISEMMANRRNSQQLQNQRTSLQLQESTLDPFRGYIDQAKDTARLDWMGNQDFTTPPVSLDKKYGAGVTLPPPRSYNVSDDTRALLGQARDQIAAGDTAAPITPGGVPLPVIKRLAGRRAMPKANPETSWLTA